MEESTRVRVYGVLLVVVLALAYLPDSGHGFIKDDFRWILESRVRSAPDLWRAFSSDNGFYRPVVTLSFAANEALFGTSPVPYALTNFLLLLACVAALYRLCRALGMVPGASLLAAGLWCLNPHGISGLVMWISGRTSSLVTLLALLAATAFLRRQRLAASLLCFLALLSKEEAFFLPIILVAWAGWQESFPRWDWRRAVRLGWPVVLPLAPYLALRSQTAAYLPTTAPTYYRFTADPAVLGRNVLEYADRSATFTVVALLLLLLATRQRPRLDRVAWSRVASGLVWLAGGFALTVFVPARSSLYACLPSVGVAIAGASIAHGSWARVASRTRSRLFVAAAIVPLLLIPLLHSRNKRPRQAASLSAIVVRQIQETWPHGSDGETLILGDSPSQRPNLREAFGTHVREAVVLATGHDAEATYVPAPGDWTAVSVRQRGAPATGSERRLRLEGLQLVPVTEPPDSN